MRIFFEEKGTKTAPTIVFVHGGLTDSRSFRNQVNHFADFHCILVDLPEYGKSFNIKPFSFKNSAESVAEIIRLKGNNGKAHVVGHSFGGIVVKELLSISPEIVDHAIIGSANSRNSVFYNFSASSIGSNFIYFINKKNFESDNITISLIRRTFKEAIGNFMISEKLYEINIPTLLVAGEKEFGFIKKSNMDLAKVLKNSKSVLIKKAQHNYHCDNYQVFNSLIRNWINDEDIINNNVILI